MDIWNERAIKIVTEIQSDLPTRLVADLGHVYPDWASNIAAALGAEVSNSGDPLPHICIPNSGGQFCGVCGRKLR